MKIYHHTARAADGKIYGYYCEKAKSGMYLLGTMEAREITDKQYLEWYNKTYPYSPESENELN